MKIPKLTEPRRPRVFISYSHDSEAHRDWVQRLASILEGNGLIVRLDRWHLDYGDDLAAFMERGVAEADRVLMICTEKYVQKVDQAMGGVGYEGQQIKGELLKSLGTKKFIPVLRQANGARLLPRCVATRLAVDLSNDNTARIGLSELLRQLRFLSAPLAPKPLGLTRRQTGARAISWRIEAVAPELIFLLMLDRYPLGVWGRSLAPTAAAYGHGHDPGSITVSRYVLRSMEIYAPQARLDEKDQFRAYLLARRTSAGGVGLRRTLNAGKASGTVLLEHCRHTAVAAAFFRENGAPVEAAAAVKFLIKKQHPDGGWGNASDRNDSPADPLTTAYVLRTLLDVSRDRKSSDWLGMSQREFDQGVYKPALRWLVAEYEYNNGMWIYRMAEDPAANAYAHSVDIVQTLPELLTNTVSSTSAKEFVDKMGQRWKDCGGLPLGLSSNVPDFSTSLYFLELLRSQRRRHGRLWSYCWKNFLMQLEWLLTQTPTTADGWSMALAVMGELVPPIPHAGSIVIESRALADSIWTRYRESDSWEKAMELANFKPDWVREIALRQIVSTEAQPL